MTTYATPEAVGWSMVSKISLSDVHVSTEPKHLNLEDDIAVLGNIAQIVAYNVVIFFPFLILARNNDGSKLRNII